MSTSPLLSYLLHVRQIHGTGQAVKETSYYPAISELFNNIGAGLKPKVHCVINLRNRGAGIPDGGLFTLRPSSHTVGEDVMLHGGLPERGAIEVKGASENADTTAHSEQGKRYLEKYGQLLVTNLREFVLVGLEPGTKDQPVILERYKLADNEESFWNRTIADPSNTDRTHGARFEDYLKRVFLYRAPLQSPQDLAWYLASYAREALRRIEQADIPALNSLRGALEDALGLKFEGEKGEHFFRSTLIQTLFYGIFSAWVLWHNKPRNPGATFNWHEAAWELHVPMIRLLFEQVAQPSKLGPLNLVEVLDWAGAALNRVEGDIFFERFEDSHAVQYFYEPFLKEFDPELRKQLGVWYTPPEIVRYMVARVDTVLREELGLADGLADPNVVVLDPCCGTGAYLVETLRKIEENLRALGEDSLVASQVRKAAIERIFGFEIMPAPFVIAHLQLGLMMQSMGAPFSLTRDDRAGVYLTNALTGWEPPKGPKTQLAMPELQAEREAASHVKRDERVLVVIGNPPYNGFAGVAMSEERTLTEAYRTTVKAPAPQGQGLNDLYVRFYRMAERRIVEMTGKGVVCFISNYSWLDGLSFTGMRERYLTAFDRIWIDNLNGDKYKTGKVTPDGKPDPSAFSTDFNREGIQVGTAIALLADTGGNADQAEIKFRNVWGRTKLEEIRNDSTRQAEIAYQNITPTLALGLPFAPSETAEGYLDWPSLPDLFPVSYPDVKTSRDDALVDIDRERLVTRMERYFDRNVSDEEVQKFAPSLMETGSRFEPKSIRDTLIARGMLANNIVRYEYRPFDVRWIYWEPVTKLLDEKRPEYFPQIFTSNLWIAACQQNRKNYDPPISTTRLASLHLIERGVNMFPMMLVKQAGANLFDQLETEDEPGYNLTESAKSYTKSLAAAPQDLIFNSLAFMHAPAYAFENSFALRQDWPRIPLPERGELLQKSATLGERVAALLDTEQPVTGVTQGVIPGYLRTIAQVTHVDGGQIDDSPGSGDFDVVARWGYAGQGGVTMPGPGKAVQRDYTSAELSEIGEYVALLGGETFDVHLNDHVCWRNVPSKVWHYTIGGYQVMKKWLSYREKALLGRALKLEEVRELTAMARRITAILLLHPELDRNYLEIKAHAFDWKSLE